MLLKKQREFKDRMKAALGVAKRMSEETQDLQELPIVPNGAAALGGAAMAINKAMKSLIVISQLDNQQFRVLPLA